MRTKEQIAKLEAKYKSYKITKEELRRLLQSEPFGRVTGIIGPFILRYRGDQLIISDRSLQYNESQNRAAIERRVSFQSEARFSSALNKINILREIWKSSPVRGISAFHKMMWCNKMKNGFPSGRNIITPPGNQLCFEHLCSLKSDFSIQIAENADFSLNDRIVVFIIPYKPKHNSAKNFETISVYIQAAPGESVSLSPEQIEVLNKYRRYLIFSAVIRNDGNSFYWSNTICEQGSIVSGEDLAQIFSLFALFSAVSRNRKSGKIHVLENIRDG